MGTPIYNIIHSATSVKKDKHTQIESTLFLVVLSKYTKMSIAKSRLNHLWQQVFRTGRSLFLKWQHCKQTMCVALLRMPWMSSCYKAHFLHRCNALKVHPHWTGNRCLPSIPLWEKSFPCYSCVQVLFLQCTLLPRQSHLIPHTI